MQKELTRMKMNLATALAAMTVIAAAGPAQAFNFSEEGAAKWLSRTELMVGAFSSSQVPLAAGLKSACTGITGELFWYGSRAPLWAVEGHRSFCRGVDAINGSQFTAGLCKELRVSARYLKQAKPGKDPDATVAAANALLERVTLILEAGKDYDLPGSHC